MIGLIACTVDNNAHVDLSVMNAEKSSIKTNLDLLKLYNDSLIMAYKVAKVPRNDATCIKYDKLYHLNDSLFNVHYLLIGEEMYEGGFVLYHYTPTSKMDDGVKSGGIMNDVIRGDTITINGYYNSMQQLHELHLTYHNGIY